MCLWFVSGEGEWGGGEGLGEAGVDFGGDGGEEAVWVYAD